MSLGAGVQTTALALGTAQWLFGPMPDCAIFADTGWEPPAVYRHLDWLEAQLPFPVYRVSAGNIRNDVFAGRSARAGRFAAIPWYMVNPDGSHGMGRRQCTAHYKLEPIRRKIRELLGKPSPKFIRPGTVEMWIGISRDEYLRAKPSKVKFVSHVNPLIEARWSRRDCAAYTLEGWDVVAPKSACECCPFHDKAMWRELKSRPEAWADVVAADAAIRGGGSSRGVRGLQYVHRDRVPLDQVDLGGPDAAQLDLFINECEGMCGV